MEGKQIVRNILIYVIIQGGTLLAAYHLGKFGKKKYDTWKTNKKISETINDKL